MEVEPVQRAAGAFQRPVGAATLTAMCERAFGRDVVPRRAIELGGGRYNTTYRVFLDHHAPVVLRIAPEPAAQYRIERELMRNEHASLSHLAPIADLMPRTLTADFTHQLIGRDFVFQTHLDGVPGPTRLPSTPDDERGPFWHDLGSIAARVHSATGSQFGRVAGPSYASWSDTVVMAYENIVADLTDAGLDATDFRGLPARAAAESALLDDIGPPRLLHGDLWTVNVMLDPASEAPRIIGVFDCDRTLWGDPLADWTVLMIGRRSERDQRAFWSGYGGRPTETDQTRRRRLFYRAWTQGEIRLELHRLGRADAVRETYAAMAETLEGLRKG